MAERGEGTPRDYAAFVDLLSLACPHAELIGLRDERSFGGYLALRVAADVYLHVGEAAFDLDFFRDEGAQGGLVTRLSAEPPSKVARAWLEAAHTATNAERFLNGAGAPDRARLQEAMIADELLRVPHGAQIQLRRAALNVFSFARGAFPSRAHALARPQPASEPTSPTAPGRGPAQ